MSHLTAATPPVMPVQEPSVAPAILMPDEPAALAADAALAELIGAVAHHPEPAPVPAGPAADLSAPPAAAPAVLADPSNEDMTMDTTTAAVDQVQDQATRLFTDAQTRTQDTMAKGARALEDMSGFAKGNVEAMVESSRLAARGLETLGQNAADYARKSFETMTAATKTLAQAKSPTEFFQIQQDLMRQGFDALVAETSRSTETMMKLAGEVAQPLSNRMAIAADRFKVAA